MISKRVPDKITDILSAKCRALDTLQVRSFAPRVKRWMCHRLHPTGDPTGLRDAAMACALALRTTYGVETRINVFFFLEVAQNNSIERRRSIEA